MFKIIHVSILKDHLQRYLKLAVHNMNNDNGVNIDIQRISDIYEDDLLRSKHVRF